MADPPGLLEAEGQFFLADKSLLISRHSGKFPVIAGGKIMGVHDCGRSAIRAAAVHYPIGLFPVVRRAGGGGYR